MTAVLLAAMLVTGIQLADSYLRFLPLKNQITSVETRRLWIGLSGWALVTVPLYFSIFAEFGIDAASYKSILMIGWAPFVLISVLAVKRMGLQHVFIVCMNALWTLLQHNWAAMLDALFFIDMPEERLLIVHSIMYLTLFALLLPIERRYFTTLLPNAQFFDNRPQGYYIAFLPIVIGLGHFMLWADERLIHSWAERFSRLSLLLIFFFLYRYVLMGARTFFAHKRTMRENQLAQEQLRSLERHNRTMLSNQKQLIDLQNNMHEDYQSILEMLRAGDVDGVRAHIDRQEARLDATKMIKFCRDPLINAAVSIYIRQAERHNIKCRHKINLPPAFATDENDFAILLSNLLENAVNASKHQPIERRELSIIVQHSGTQFVLEIANRFDGTLVLDEDGLPTTTREGHGIGMSSVQSFVEKYKAQAMFAQSDGWVTFSMYWGGGGRLDVGNNFFCDQYRGDSTDRSMASILAV
ncbi:MAG: sensor histidine kinase [Selenomonadaceae bacterium]|nr:sensor histidine kinase [Selenomonadaceae bacterium]